MALNAQLKQRLSIPLEKRRESGGFRSLNVCKISDEILNFANNDYLGLSSHPSIQVAGREAIDRYGASSSASPLITGYGPAHESLLQSLKQWYGIEHGVIWNSGYVANQALLSSLPEKGDLVLADRLIHNSMISGILASGARLTRYRHCDVAHLESLLVEAKNSERMVFVVTESVFSVDGDYPDLKAIAALKEKYGFFWIVDEAHAVGWYGDKGSGLCEAFEALDQVDCIVGTLGKALGSMGAYTLFKDSLAPDYLVNFAGEFIYSTYLPPVCAAMAEEAIRQVSKAAAARGQEASRRIRAQLIELGYNASRGDSAIVSIRMDTAEKTVSAAEYLKRKGILVGAVRPPTVPEGTSRLRLSLKASMDEAVQERLISAFEELRGSLK